MAMKELGKRMHCDPSFVTLVADMLEKRGLARREPHPADRRVKNLVLTSDGEALKQQVEAEITARMPWNRALNDSERAQLLALIRKMLSADDQAADAGASAKDALHEPLSSLLTSALQDSIAQESAPDDQPPSPPASDGGGEGRREPDLGCQLSTGSSQAAAHASDPAGLGPPADHEPQGPGRPLTGFSLRASARPCAPARSAHHTSSAVKQRRTDQQRPY